MCLLVPGKIVKIEDNKATVDYEAEKRVGLIVEGKYKVGDYVMVQGGIVIQKIGAKEAKQALKLYIDSIREP